METQTSIKPVELGDTGQIVLPKIDISAYIGKKVKIESVTEHEGNYGYFVKIESEVIDTIEGGKEPIKIVASRIFGLQQDAEGKIGWAEGTNLDTFLKKMKVKHYRDLKGKNVIAQSVTNKKDNRDYLSFN